MMSKLKQRVYLLFQHVFDFRTRVNNKNIDSFKNCLNNLILFLIDISILFNFLHLNRHLLFFFDLLLLRLVPILLKNQLFPLTWLLEQFAEHEKVYLEQVKLDTFLFLMKCDLIKEEDGAEFLWWLKIKSLKHLVCLMYDNSSHLSMAFQKLEEGHNNVCLNFL